ncbi:MAG: AAA family ATPase [Actinomycetes bacterium]
MRPLRLELAGFGSFVEPTVVDLADTDLFVLTGPTGAGKSTLIDAMVFALYGSVPRYDDRRIVAPVITQGRNEARVRLTFAVGEQTWAATRVVRRTPKGATTKEARLERVLATGDTEVVAGTADELTASAERLLGLRFEHFTRTVVLPQGDVHEFLHANAKERQDLLVQLLGLEVYRDVATRARSRAAAAAGRVDTLAERLADLEGVTPDALAAAEAERSRLGALRERVTEAETEIAELRERGDAARRAVDEATTRLDRVRAIVVPDDVAEVAAAVSAARGALEGAGAEEERAVAAVTAAEEALAALPERGAVDALVRAHAEVARCEAAVTTAEGHLEATRTTAEESRTHAARLAADAEAAEAALRRAERAELAHAVAADLEAGAPCPVCTQVVTTLPHHEPPADLATARRTRDEAVAAAREATGVAERAAQDAATAAGAAQAARTSLDDARSEREQRAAAVGLPATEPEAATALADRVAAATRACDEARAAAREATAARTSAEQHLRAAEHAAGAAWGAFDRSRDAVADLGPPAVERTDLGAAWQALAAFAAGLVPELEAAAEAATRGIEAAREAWRACAAALRDEVRAGGVHVPDDAGPPEATEAVVRARTRAEAAVTNLAQQLETVAELTDRRAEAERERDLATELGRQLDAKHFERWLLTQALQRLLVGATARLDELTGGAYSLTVDTSGVIEVVDHRNADERRPVKTLSGGETFLASLALALALADQVAELASGGAARLEALFLDEGFGTLDGETLDTVATALSELGQQGRMVGLVTHVRELAEQIPTRFEVRKVGASSSVTRVDA